MRGRARHFTVRHAASTAAAFLLVGAPFAAQAVPSFARQTGMACEACHTVWPELTHFGRVFKANGFALVDLLVPFSDCRHASAEPISSDNFHPSPYGHRCAAAAIARAVMALPPRPPSG
jgi:hypothetical protein